MSRILRRPMFRGGPVSSYGTGIASGLGYESGGRVEYANGGSSGLDFLRKAFSSAIYERKPPAPQSPHYIFQQFHDLRQVGGPYLGVLIFLRGDRRLFS